MFNVRENVSNPSEKSKLQNRTYTISIMSMCLLYVHRIIKNCIEMLLVV